MVLDIITSCFIYLKKMLADIYIIIPFYTS